MNEVAVHLQNVHVTLGSGAAKVHVLRGIDLVIPKRTSVGLVGPSGSGKSTLLMVIAGLEHIDTGSVSIAGQNFSHLDEDALAAFRGENVGFVFQGFHLMQTMTALENVAVPMELAGRANAFDQAREMLDRVGLGERLGHYPAQLSGGEQQRVAIARALSVRPTILIADEPTGNLDSATGTEVADLIFKVAEESGTTLLLVTHDEGLAGRCDQVVRITAGQILDEPVKPALRSA